MARGLRTSDNVFKPVLTLLSCHDIHDMKNKLFTIHLINHNSVSHDIPIVIVDHVIKPIKQINHLFYSFHHKDKNIKYCQ